MIYIGFDHRGSELAYTLVEKLLNMEESVNMPTELLGEVVDYPTVAKEVCAKVKGDNGSIGILICGTGIGMCMAANRQKGIRAVLANNEEQAYFARRHEDANVLVLSAGYKDENFSIKQPKKVLEIINTFKNTMFEGGRHTPRIEMLDL